MLGLLKLDGSPYDCGKKYGESQAANIQNFLRDDYCLVNKLRKFPFSKEQLLILLKRYACVIEQYLPEVVEELKGLANGASISYLEAVLFQIRRELIDYNEGDCTTYVGRGNKNKIIGGQTIDLNGGMSGYSIMLDINSDCSPRILMYSFSGLLGYIGMNELGLSVFINMVHSQPWNIGISPYLIVRKMLSQNSVEDCVRIMEQIPRSSSRCFTITDKKTILTIESTPEIFRIIEGDHHFHTNHYLHEDLKGLDRLNFFSKKSSQKRLSRLEELVNNNLNEISPNKLFELLSDHSNHPLGICTHNEGHLISGETVGSVIIDTAQLELFACKGHPCENQLQKFKFN